MKKTMIRIQMDPQLNKFVMAFKLKHDHSSKAEAVEHLLKICEKEMKDDLKKNMI